MSGRSVRNAPGTELCFWDPVKNLPASGIPVKGGYDDYYGCHREAVLCVGTEAWHLCRECADLPRFSRLRKRSELRRASPSGT